MKSNPEVIKNEAANFLSHKGHCRFTVKAEQGQPQDYTKTNLSINGEPQHTAAHFLEAILWQYPKELPQSCVKHSGECSGVPPCRTETALPALGTTSCAAVAAAVLGVLKKHERNICSWHCSCDTNLKILNVASGQWQDWNSSADQARAVSIWSASWWLLVCGMDVECTFPGAGVVGGQGYSLVGLEDKTPGNGSCH